MSDRVSVSAVLARLQQVLLFCPVCCKCPNLERFVPVLLLALVLVMVLVF
jgi:hypothetical protein